MGVAAFFATGVVTFFATGVVTFFATGVVTFFATGVVTFFATEVTFSVAAAAAFAAGESSGDGTFGWNTGDSGPAPFRSRLGENRLAAAGADARRLGLPHLENHPGISPHVTTGTSTSPLASCRMTRSKTLLCDEYLFPSGEKNRLRLRPRSIPPPVSNRTRHASESFTPARSCTCSIKSAFACARSSSSPSSPSAAGESSSESATASSSPEEGFAAESSTAPRDLNADANVSTMPRANPPRLRRRAGVRSSSSQSRGGAAWVGITASSSVSSSASSVAASAAGAGAEAATSPLVPWLRMRWTTAAGPE